MPKGGKSTRKKKNTELDTGTEPGDDRDEQYHIMSTYLRVNEAKRILGGQFMPSKFRFRQKEIALIEKTIHNLLLKDKIAGSRIIMITGSPGAGKTLSANYILKKCPYKVIALNSNVIKRKKDVQRILAEQILCQDLEDKDLTTFKVISQLEKAKNIQPCILYIEEVELFFNSTKQFLSQDFFSLFSHKSIKVLLLGISNTIDALEKYGPKLNVQVSDISNIVFNPYTVDEMKQIIEEKILAVKNKLGINVNITQKMIKFSINKINQIKKGDMRMVFEFLRSLSTKLFPPNQQIDEEQLPDAFDVDIKVVKSAFDQMKTQNDKLINKIPFQQQIILIALYNLFAVMGEIQTTEDSLKSKVKEIYSSLGIQPKKDIGQELSQLQVYGFIECKKKPEGKPNLGHRYLLKLPTSQIKYSFESHQILGKFVEE